MLVVPLLILLDHDIVTTCLSRHDFVPLTPAGVAVYLRGDCALGAAALLGEPNTGGVYG